MACGNSCESILLSHIVDFISRYNFLYGRPNIKFFSEDLWRHVPEDWLQYLTKLNNDELNSFPFQKSKSHCPETLNEFRTAGSKISYLFNSYLATVQADDLTQYPTPLVEGSNSVKAKKRHEVEVLTTILKAYCKLHNINRIVDVGCGVGHLLNQLSRYFKVVGVECDEKLCQRAKKTCAYAEIICLNVICDGTEDRQLMEFLLGNEFDRTAVVSLHGCGDLQPTLLRHFCKLDRNRVPIIFTVPCCYHKMSNLENKMFHWAMSDEGRRTSISYNVLPVSALRLACQKHISCWPCSRGEREKHTKHFISRALLECLYDGNENLRSLAYRNINRRFKDLKSAGAELAARLGMDESDISLIDQLYKMIFADKEPYFEYVEPFTLLQSIMQTPLELFVLLDRMFYLREFGCSARILSIFNPLISSRHLCIMAS